MNRQNNSIKSALQQTANAKPTETDQPFEEPNAQPQKRTPARQDTKLIAGHYPKEVHYQLKLISLETDTSIQDLLGNALNLLFEQHDKPPIA